MKKVISVIIALVLLFVASFSPASSYQTTTYRMNSDHLALFSDFAGTYLLTYSGSDCHIEKLCPDSLGADLHLDHSIADVRTFGNTVVALCNDTKNIQLEVYTYLADTDVLESFAVNDIGYDPDVGFCYDGDSIYLVSDRDKHIVERYGITGELIDRYSFKGVVTQLSADDRGHAFAVSAGSLYRMDSGRFSAVSGAGVTVPVSFISDSLFCDASGRCFDIAGSTYKQKVKFDTDFGKISACCINGIVYCPIDDAVYGYALSSGEKRSVIKLSDTILGVYAYNGYVCSLRVNGSPRIDRIRPDEFTGLLDENIVTPAEKATNAVRQDQDVPPTEDSTEIESDQTNTNRSISSSAYRIDFSSMCISCIPFGTTLAQFKRNICYDGYRISFYRNGAQKKSGKCGTGMKAIFESDRAKYTFELSVIGDITGEGNVNSRDLSLLMEYLLGTAGFDGVYLISADLSGGGRIDIKDLAMMHRMF